MCGLVAVINKNQYGFGANQLDVFENLLYVDAVRGEDSTGVFCVTNAGNVHIAKEAQDSNHFLKQQEWKTLRNLAYTSGWALVGHNRKATRGTINDTNAHPFWVEDKLVLVHNGSLLGDHKKLADTEVDSHAIAHVLAEEKDVEKALRRIQGAYALIWYDIEEQKLKIIRNDERPLFWCETKDAFYIASEEAMLYFALWRAGESIINKDHWAVPFEPYRMTTMHSETRKITDEVLDCRFRPTARQDQETSTWDMREWMSRLDECDGDACALPSDKLPQQRTLGRSRLISLDQWETLRKENYMTGRKIRVIVDDFEWDIHGDSRFAVFKGKTTDGNMHAVEFNVPIAEAQRMTRKKDETPIYEIQIGSVTWHKMDAVVDTSGAVLGAVVVHGHNPVNLMVH